MKLSRDGVHLNIDGDEIIWLWRKAAGYRWYSATFGDLFKSLAAIRSELEAYWDYPDRRH